MKIKYIILICACLAMFGCTNTTQKEDQGMKTESVNSSDKIAYYTCSMHHQVHKDKPGECPICGMKLNPVMTSKLQPQDHSEMKQKEDNNSKSGREIAYYTCSMHHQVHKDKPGKCPICGMKLNPVMKSELQPQGHSTMQSSAQLKLSPHQQFMAGVTIEPAKKVELNPQLILTGKTLLNPQKTQIISAWVSGWIQKSYVRNPGERIRVGQKLYKLYSPKLLAVERDYLVAIKQESLYRKADVDLSKTIQALQQKLSRWGLSAIQIKHLTTERPSGEVTVYSKQSGYLTQKLKEEGDYVSEGETIFKLANNSDLWVQAQLYDSELSYLTSSSEVFVKIAGSDKRIKGEIVFQNPVNQTNSRLHLVYISIPNQIGEIQSGMMAYVYLQSHPAESVLTVSQSAIVYEENRTYVWRVSSDNNFERKMVKLGKVDGNKIAILNGLKQGDKVVSSGIYLVNSEYRLKNGGMNMAGMQMSDMKMGGKSE